MKRIGPSRARKGGLKGGLKICPGPAHWAANWARLLRTVEMLFQ
jgi:hypothetical protein